MVGLGIITVVGVYLLASNPNTPANSYTPNLKPAQFVSVIDNPYFTLTPGDLLEYTSQTEDGLERVLMNVTSDTKTILGIQATVVHDRVYLNDALIEDTYDWYAQDKTGNVWYLGEGTKELADGQVTSTRGSWEAGVDGAEAGIIMLAEPKIGDEYRQEYYAGEAEDMAQVLALDETVEIGLGTYTGCLKTLDWTPLEAKIDEHKFYCPAVGGLALELGVYSNERLELINKSRTGYDE